jgi:hypothetical protein
MPIPERELVPKAKPGPKPGSKSHPNEILKRVVQIGQMLHIQGMTLTEIYQWNIDPDRGVDPETGQPLPGGNPWGYGLRQLSDMVRKAQALGAQLLIKDYETALRIQLRQWYDLKRKAIAGGDFRVAAVCIAQIAKITDSYQGKAGRAKVMPGGRRTDFLWVEPKALAAGPAAVDFKMKDLDSLADSVTGLS